MANNLYLFTTEHEGLATELWFNGILLDEDPEGVFRDRKFPNNLYVIDGENTLKLKISLPGHPPRMPDSPKLSARLYEMGQESTDLTQLPEPIAELNFPGEEAPTFPAELETTVSIQSPFPRWSWQDAEPMDVSDGATVRECLDLVERLHKALTAKDLQTVMDLVSTKTEETAQAYYIPMNERISDQQTFFEEIFADAQFAMEPYDAQNMELVPMADDKLILVRQSNGSAALESKELIEGFCFTLPIYVSKVNGEIRIVR